MMNQPLKLVFPSHTNLMTNFPNFKPEFGENPEAEIGDDHIDIHAIKAGDAAHMCQTPFVRTAKLKVSRPVRRRIHLRLHVHGTCESELNNSCSVVSSSEPVPSEVLGWPPFSTILMSNNLPAR
jgi:hypothetical protein